MPAHIATITCTWNRADRLSTMLDRRSQALGGMGRRTLLIVDNKSYSDGLSRPLASLCMPRDVVCVRGHARICRRPDTRFLDHDTR